MYFLIVLALLKISGAESGFSLSSIFKSHETPCSSRMCIQSAASFLQSMNQSYNPCEDFFSYTCGNYMKENPIPDSQLMHDHNRRKELEYELKAKAMLQKEESDNDPESVNKAKTLFRACTDTDAIEEEGFRAITDALEIAGLSLIPSSPDDNFDWLLANVDVQKRLGEDVLLQFAVLADPRNKTLKRLGIGVPRYWTFVTEPHRYQKKDFRSKIELAPRMKVDAAETKAKAEDETYDVSASQDEIKYAKSILDSFLAESDHDLSNGQIKKMKKALEDAVVLENAVETVQETYNSPDLESTTHTLKGLQTILDDSSKTRHKSPINLSWFFTETFEGVENVTLHLTDNTPVVVSSVEYLKYISNFVKKHSPRRLAMLFWWRIVKRLAPLSTRALRALTQEFKNVLYGFEYDVKSRALLCTQTVLKTFPFAVAYKIMDQAYLKRITPGVQEMFENLRRVFKQNISSYKWLDSADRQTMIEKLDAIKPRIGLPDWVFDAEELDYYYSYFFVCEDHFAQSLVNISSAVVMSSLTSFNQTQTQEDEDGGEWGSLNLFTPNAFYFLEENSMVILLPQLEHPFYDLGLEALNYGALASLIGHELSHAFDASGRTYDKIGNKVVKWSNTSVVNYTNKTDCLVRQYDSVYLPEVDQHVDGRKTLNENIADNAGLRLAVAAYRMWVRDHGQEKPLPGLEEFSSEQLLFLSFAAVDCHSATNAAMLNMLRDEHSPTKVRINVTVTNMQDFYSAWNCKNTNTTGHRQCRLF